MSEISIVIVSYNVKPFLEQALNSILKALEGISSEIFVVDNGSGDGSALLVKERFPQVKLIENKENLGFARANNQALKIAKGKNLCLINPDTLVQEDTFKVCLDYLNTHSDVGMVGCKILNPDGTLQLSCRRSFPTPWVAFTKVTGLSHLFPRSKFFSKYNLTYLDPDKEAEVDAVSGSFMMAKRKVIEEVGFLDEIFFLYGEDLDWCYRIKQKGWKIIYLPQTQIIHYKGQSAREAPFDVLKVFYQAMYLFIKKHFKKGWSFLPRWFLVAGVIIRGGISFFSRFISKGIIPLIDTAFLQLGLLFAIFIRFGHLHYWTSYGIVNLVYTIIWIASLSAMGLYKKGAYSSSKALAGCVMGLFLNASFTFFFPQYAFSRQVLLVAGFLDGIFLSGWRLILRVASRIHNVSFIGKMGEAFIRRRALIVGTDRASHEIIERLKNRINPIYEVVGMLALEEKDLFPSKDRNVPVLGTLKDLERIASTHRIQEVIFSPEAASYERILSIVASGKDLHLNFKMVPRNLDVIIGETSIDTLEDIPLLNLDYKIFSGMNQFLKRSMDIFVSCLIIPFTLPVLFYLFIHPSFQFKRVLISDGKNNSIPIKELWKDGRKVSSWLRLIPLFGQVLLGRMSLVGTEIITYQDSVPGKGFKPGLTGLVQINLYRNLDDAEKNRYNLYYLKNYSILLDLEIIFRALFRV